MTKATLANPRISRRVKTPKQKYCSTIRLPLFITRLLHHRFDERVQSYPTRRGCGSLSQALRIGFPSAVYLADRGRIPALNEAVGQQVVGDADGIGDDGQGWVYGAA